MKSIIFDFDGTIINTNDSIIRTLKKVAKDKLNRKIDDETLTKMYGLTIDEQMKILDKSRYSELIDYYFDIYSYELENHTDLFDGIEKLLNDLKKEGHNLFILTNNNTKDTTYALKKFNIFKCFDDIITMDDVTLGKPNPEGLDLLFKKNDLKKDNTLLIGDSPHDIEAGIDFKIETVLVGWTIFNEKDFKVKPDYIINKPKDLFSVL